MAAVLDCGPEAVLSHRSAVALYELRPVAAGPIDVTVPGRTRSGQAGIRVHQQLRLAVEAADRAELLDVRALEGLIARSRGRRGVKPLKAALAEMRGRRRGPGRSSDGGSSR